MTQYGFYFDQGRCYGCKACSVACKDRNDIAPGPEKWMSAYIPQHVHRHPRVQLRALRQPGVRFGM